MLDGLLLFSISLLATVGIRAGVWFVPEVDIKIFRTTIHHFWFGILLGALSYPLSLINYLLGVIALGIGLGLAADEFVFMLNGAGRDKQYWAAPSVLGTIVLLIVIFYFRTTLVSLLY
jgi:hypothetical protein